MNKIFLFVAISILIFLNSCITSVHRLVTYNKIVNETWISGDWEYEGMKIIVEPLLTSQLVRTGKKEGKKIFDGINKNDSVLFAKSYIFRYEKGFGQYDMMASFISLNNQLFLDISSLNIDSVGKPSSFSGFSGGTGAGEWVTTHTFAKATFKNTGSLELQFLDGGFISGQIKKGQAAVKHEKDDLFNTMVITASSEELQQFLTKYGNNERLYNKENTVILKKLQSWPITLTGTTNR